MSFLRFFGKLIGAALGRLCQQRWLLAGLALLYVLLPLGAGRAAEDLLSRGVELSGITLAVTAPEGDETPRLLERFMGDMEDIAQYCRILAMGEEEALSALRAGEVTAVLCLPENFIRGVMWGDNPDLRLVVSGDRPLESLLLLWVGQSAADILAAFQSGVYAVLELYEAAPPPGLTRDRVVAEINVRYITLAVDRAGMFRTREVSATQALPIALHYGLTLLFYFALSAAPLFLPLYGGDWLVLQRRLRGAGRGSAAGCLSAVTAGAAVLLLLLAPALLAAGEGAALPRLGAAALAALFCSVFCGLCCLLTGSAAGCGTAAFGVSLVSLALAGGIVPPVLLPGPVRKLSWLSPLTWLRQAAARSMGYPAQPACWAYLLLSGLGMLCLCLALYRRRVDGGEAEQ